MRIVIKLGTSTLTHGTGKLNIRRVELLCKVMSDLKNAGHELVLVSSGAIAMGIGKLNMTRKPTDIPTKQALAAVGQCELMYIYDKLFSEYHHTVAQVLLTGTDVEDAHRRMNFQNTLFRLLDLGAIPVIAVAGHDTASAVAAVPALNRNFAYLSSGTWSLMGVETDAPVITEETERLNFTNEGGVAGTIRLLKNICGMWLLERCRTGWENISYPELIAEAEEAEPFRSLINPDDACFANPADMQEAICRYCAETNQPVPETRGQIVRCIFESLALRYRQVLENLCNLSPMPIETLHVIGGGSRNELLNQFTANAIGIPVIAGPSEATAIGNVMIQAMTAGEAEDIKGMRQLIHNSIPLKTYQPQKSENWDTAYIHFKHIIS